MLNGPEKDEAEENDGGAYDASLQSSRHFLREDMHLDEVWLMLNVSLVFSRFQISEKKA
jgi:hypothetical protein